MLTPEFDDTPQVVFVSCPTTSTLKAAHGSVFHSDHCTTETTDAAVFALAPSTPVSVSRLVPECTATAKHPATTSHSVSILTIPSCAFACAETLLAAAHADGIHPKPVYTSDHPTRSVSTPVIPSRAFAAAANADRIVSEIIRTSVHATAAALSPVAVPTTVDRKSKAEGQVFSTTDSSAIGYITSSDLECIPVEGATKCQKTGPSSGRLDAVAIPWATRTSTRVSKSASNFNSKKDIGDLFCRLGQEFEVVTKTFKEIAELME